MLNLYMREVSHWTYSVTQCDPQCESHLISSSYEISTIRPIHTHRYLLLRPLDITHLKYWFCISSIFEKTKNSTKTSNTSFERSGSGLPKSWRLGCGSIMGLPWPLFLKSSIYHKEWAWQANKNAMPPIFRILKAHYQTFQMRYCFFLYYSWFSLKLIKAKISIWGVWYQGLATVYWCCSGPVLSIYYIKVSLVHSRKSFFSLVLVLVQHETTILTFNFIAICLVRFFSWEFNNNSIIRGLAIFHIIFYLCPRNDLFHAWYRTCFHCLLILVFFFKKGDTFEHWCFK